MASTDTASKDSSQRRFEFNFPILTVRTQWFGALFDRLGSLRASRWLSWGSLFIVPIVAGFGLYMIVGSLLVLLWNPAAAEAIRDIGPGAYLLLPGINPFLPLFYGWFALICAIAIHEGAHGIVARSLGLKVNSSGLLFFLFVPIGAFVDVDEEQLKKAQARVSSRALAAGVGGNTVIAAVCFISVFLIVGGLTPVIDGVYVYGVTPGKPAEIAGLQAEDVIVSMNNIRINNTSDLRAVLDNKAPGDLVQVTVARGPMWKNNFSTGVTLILSENRTENRTVMGITIGDLMLKERLTFYQNVTLEKLTFYLVPPAFTSELVPFSDSLASFYTHPLGSQWHVLANSLFWLWFVNINLAAFNALPIYPLDGGRIFNVGLKRLVRRKDNEKLVSAITMTVTAAIILALVLTFVIPFVI